MSGEKSKDLDLDPCIPEEYLRGYVQGNVQRWFAKVVEAHLKMCADCSAKVTKFRHEQSSREDLIRKQLAQLRQKQSDLLRHQSQGTQPGTLWRTRPELEKDVSGPMVFVLSSSESEQEKIVTVAEVSEEFEQAMETDILLDPPESGLSFRCMVRSSTVFDTDSDNLTEFVGKLTRSMTQKALEFCRRGEGFSDNLTLSEVIFLRDDKGNEFMRRKGVTSGLMVTLDDDRRLYLAKLSSRSYRYLHLYRPGTSESISSTEEKPGLLRKLKGMISRGFLRRDGSSAATKAEDKVISPFPEPEIEDPFMPLEPDFAELCSDLDLEEMNPLTVEAPVSVENEEKTVRLKPAVGEPDSKESNPMKEDSVSQSNPKKPSPRTKDG